MSSELERAARIAYTLAREAIWYEDRCNWLGATRSGPAALGPDLYAGTAGVALFLAEASVVLDDRVLRAIARGAINHALRHAGTLGDGLHAGALGALWGAGRAACVLGDDVASCRALAPRPSGRPDVIDGRAGAVLGLLALGSEQAAIEAGVTLLGMPLPLPCGYAHGAAGVGHALVELFASTGEDRFREAGERAFEHVRSWQDPHTGSWPDLRGVSPRAARSAPLPAAHARCQGAAGIAPAQARADEILGGQHSDLAVAAVEVGADAVLSGGPADPCLCHGAAGIADVLLSLGEEELATALAGRLHDAGPPGLLTGRAGVGLFCLRLVDRGVSSVLAGCLDHGVNAPVLSAKP